LVFERELLVPWPEQTRPPLAPIPEPLNLRQI
jgi:hypothetical protein